MCVTDQEKQKLGLVLDKLCWEAFDLFGQEKFASTGMRELTNEERMGIARGVVSSFEDCMKNGVSVDLPIKVDLRFEDQHTAIFSLSGYSPTLDKKETEND